MKINRNVLGGGIDFPVVYDAGRIKKAEAVESVEAAVNMLFATRPGTRFMDPDYGSQLYYLLFEPCTVETAQAAAIFAREDILTWIPRVEWVRVRGEIFPEDSRIDLVISYRLRQDPSERLMTYPYYLMSDQFKERQPDAKYDYMR